MTRYVISHRYAGILTTSARAQARRRTQDALASIYPSDAELVGQVVPKDTRARATYVIEASPRDVARQLSMFGNDVLVEKEILHDPQVARWPGSILPAVDESPPAQRVGLTLHVEDDRGDRQANVSVALLLQSPVGSLTSVTERSTSVGEVRLTFDATSKPVAALATPYSGFWPAIISPVANGAVLTLRPLPEVSTNSWWRDLVGAPTAASPGGVRIGIADTGVGPHPYLVGVELGGAFVDGAHDPTPEATRDVSGHGTHVAGILGSTGGPGNPWGPVGIALGCPLVVVRVFASAEASANQADVANAIDYLSREQRCDLVNLSLGSNQPSEIEHDAIRDAAQRGTLCLCAAGNFGDAIQYPAAFEECVAVSALGLDGWAPVGTLEASMKPTTADRQGADGLFLATFSCFGTLLDACAPGTGIVSLVPATPQDPAPVMVMDGTSMATPVACAALAEAIARGQPGLPPDATRTAAYRSMLESICRTVGLAEEYEGKGVPSLSTAGHGA